MSAPTADDMGHGVEARPEPAGSWTVTSRGLDLGWQARRGLSPGTAVIFRDQLFEVAEREHGATGLRWRLVPWPEGETARVVSGLDAGRVAATAATSSDEARSRTIRRRLVAILPLAGLLPRGVQQRLQRNHNFPAGLATEVSAAHEIVLGGLGLIQVIGARISTTVPPVHLRWLILLSPLLLCEGFIRLALAISQGEPIGSLCTWPLTWFGQREPPPDRWAGYRPQAVRCDPRTGVLELATTRVRPDWVEDGVLQYRGHRYRLVEREPGRGRMIYRFEPAGDDTPPTLQLLPPQAARSAGGDEPGLGLVTLTFRILLMSFAPRQLQERWFRARDTSPLVATATSAFTEALGGIINLVDRQGSGAWHLLDLFFLVEGSTRLAIALSRGHAAGSLLGRPFLPLYRRWLEEADPTPRVPGAAGRA